MLKRKSIIVCILKYLSIRLLLLKYFLYKCITVRGDLLAHCFLVEIQITHFARFFVIKEIFQAPILSVA